MLFPGRKERLGLQNFKILHKPMVNVRKHLKEVQTITPLESGLAMRSRYLTFLTYLSAIAWAASIYTQEFYGTPEPRSSQIFYFLIIYEYE